MQDAARLVTNLQTESDGVDLVTLLRETPREAYSFQQLGVSIPPVGAPNPHRPNIAIEPFSAALHPSVHGQRTDRRPAF